MSNRPKKAAFVNPQDIGLFPTVFDALFSELHKLALLCSICHATKTYAESELLFLSHIGNYRIRQTPEKDMPREGFGMGNPQRQVEDHFAQKNDEQDSSTSDSSHSRHSR